MKFASTLQERLQIAAQAISANDPSHSGAYGEEPRFAWSYDADDHSIDLDVITQYEENTSCSCHPEYSTRENQTFHNIPADELAPTMDAEIDDEWDFSLTPWFRSFLDDIRVKKDAAQKKAAAEAAARADAQRRATEKRERDELARLQSKYKG